MEALRKIREFIKGLDDKEFFKYFSIFLGVFFVIFATLFYFDYNRINKYENKIQAINKERQKTKKILSHYKLVSQQKNKVEELLEKYKHFYIAETYNKVIEDLGLLKYQPEEPITSEGNIIGGKKEKILTAHLDSITMEQLTKLLEKLAEIEMIYPKELTIKKTPNAKAIDVNLTIATLESTTTE